MSHHGIFVWYELVTSDLVGAQRFYETVVGWRAADSGLPDMTYMLLHAGEISVAGLMEIPSPMRENGAKPAWLGYVAVNDVDTCAAQTLVLGGSVHREPTDIPGIGRFCVVTDPQGAVIVPFRGVGEAPPSMGFKPGHPSWRELMAADLDAAFAFYAALVGWTKAEAVELGDMGTYQMFAAGGETLGGMMTKPPQMPHPPHWRYYFNVDGIDAAAERIAAAGGTVVHGPAPVPGGNWVVQALDPQGAIFGLVSAGR